MKNTTGVI
jgi:RNA polymerase sigma factor (sigma-70 family)